MKKLILLFTGLAFFTFKNQAQSVTDIDGNIYNMATIGSQIWLEENLKVTHYQNGDSIPNVIDGISWGNHTTGAYCYYDNDTNIAGLYGNLYNYYAVIDIRNICPAGWHVPALNEWTTLINYLGGNNVAGGKMKEADTTHWNSPNTGATNESGFTALPGGYRYIYGPDFQIRNYGYWWSVTEADPYFSYLLSLEYHDGYTHLLSDSKGFGFSVRCMRDSTSQINEINYQGKMKIYPNPAIDKIYITSAERQDVKMQVYNMIGECILQKALNNGVNNIDISSLSKGVYIIILTGYEWTVQRKLTKE